MDNSNKVIEIPDSSDEENNSGGANLVDDQILNELKDALKDTVFFKMIAQNNENKPLDSAALSLSFNEPEKTSRFKFTTDLKDLAIQIANERVRLNFMLQLVSDKIDFAAIDDLKLLESELRKRFEAYRKQRED